MVNYTVFGLRHWSIMASVPGQIVRRGGISRTIFIISLVVVAVVAGLGGYFTNAFLHPGVPTIELNGDGSTLVYPVLSAWTSNYNKLHTNVQINYQPVGSGTRSEEHTSELQSR